MSDAEIAPVDPETPLADHHDVVEERPRYPQQRRKNTTNQMLAAEIRELRGKVQQQQMLLQTITDALSAAGRDLHARVVHVNHGFNGGGEGLGVPVFLAEEERRGGSPRSARQAYHSGNCNYQGSYQGGINNNNNYNNRGHNGRKFSHRNNRQRQPGPPPFE